MKGFKVEQVLVEERLDIEREFYAGVIINDSEKCPVVIFSSKGGTGIEEIAREYPDKVARANLDVRKGLSLEEARSLVGRTGIQDGLRDLLAGALVTLYEVARQWEARACEINPLVLLKNGELCAADCRVSIDDYAVFRHPELGIEIAREFDRPATELEKIAWKVEANDYRGTFYYIQMAQGFKKERQLPRVSRGRGRGLDDEHGRGPGPGLQAGHVLRHQRKPPGVQGLPRGQDHPLHRTRRGLLLPRAPGWPARSSSTLRAGCSRPSGRRTSRSRP